MTTDKQEYAVTHTIDSINILVPAYNEQESLKELHDRTRKVMQELEIPYEFIFVNDGSSDDTFRTMQEIRAEYDNVTVVSYSRNHGKSTALMMGLDEADGHIVVVMDADLQDAPEDIPLFLDKIREGYDIVSGHRSQRMDAPAKRFVSKVYNYLSSKLVCYRFNDINCGMKVFTREVARLFELRGDMHRLMPAIAVCYGKRYAEIEVNHSPRKFGCSKYPLLRHRGLLDLISFAVLRTTQTRPFHIVTEIGLLFLVLSALLLTTNYFLPPVQESFLSYSMLTLGIWFGLLGTLCPFAGLILESVASKFQNHEWRHSLPKTVYPAKNHDAP